MKNMNLKKWTSFKKIGAFVLVAGLLAAMRLIGAQSVIMGAPPDETAKPPALQEDQTNSEMNVFVPAGMANNSLPQPFRFGPLTFRPHPYYRFEYGNGIQSGPGSQRDTIIQEVSPGIT